ncbi:MAG TPA: peptidyl-alpha-hydroxyglycine alpha-amidating lyase family protein [Gammaproteobacteria bacterium]
MLIERMKLAVPGALVLLVGCTSSDSGNIITGEGIPNPNPVTTNQWGELPAGRAWGHTAGIDIDPTDGHIWAYERCGAGGGIGPDGGAGGALAGPVNCDTNPVDPIFKFDRNTGEVLANFGAGIFTVPHGIHVDFEGNVWVTDFATSADGTKGQQVHKFSPDGELLMSLGVAGRAGNDGAHFNQPNDVIVAADGSIFVADGHNGQGMTTAAAVEEGRRSGQTGRIMKFAADGTFITQWGRLGAAHGEFRTPHALEIDSQGRLWVADRGNHRLELFDLEGNYLESRYSYGRISGIFITEDDLVYAIDSESSPYNHVNWIAGIRVGPLNEDRITAFVPGYPTEARGYQSTAGEGVAVAADGTIFVAEGPASIPIARGAFTRYSAN